MVSGMKPRIHSAFCTICHNSGQLIQCHGRCNRSYHANCILQTIEATAKQSNHLGAQQPGCAVPDGWQCPECLNVSHVCLVCGSHGPDDKQQYPAKCDKDDCGRFYHISCLQQLDPSIPWTETAATNDTSNPMVITACPAHTCHVCRSSHGAVADPVSTQAPAQGSGLVTCWRCPRAYHLPCLPSTGKAIKASQTECECPPCAFMYRFERARQIWSLKLQHDKNQVAARSCGHKLPDFDYGSQEIVKLLDKTALAEVCRTSFQHPQVWAALSQRGTVDPKKLGVNVANQQHGQQSSNTKPPQPVPQAVPVLIASGPTASLSRDAGVAHDNNIRRTPVLCLHLVQGLARDRAGKVLNLQSNKDAISCGSGGGSVSSLGQNLQQQQSQALQQRSGTANPSLHPPVPYASGAQLHVMHGNGHHYSKPSIMYTAGNQHGLNMTISITPEQVQQAVQQQARQAQHVQRQQQAWQRHVDAPQEYMQHSRQGHVVNASRHNQQQQQQILHVQQQQIQQQQQQQQQRPGMTVGALISRAAILVPNTVPGSQQQLQPQLQPLLPQPPQKKLQQTTTKALNAEQLDEQIQQAVQMLSNAGRHNHENSGSITVPPPRQRSTYPMAAAPAATPTPPAAATSADAAVLGMDKGANPAAASDGFLRENEGVYEHHHLLQPEPSRVLPSQPTSIRRRGGQHVQRRKPASGQQSKDGLSHQGNDASLSCPSTRKRKASRVRVRHIPHVDADARQGTAVLTHTAGGDVGASTGKRTSRLAISSQQADIVQQPLIESNTLSEAGDTITNLVQKASDRLLNAVQTTCMNHGRIDDGHDVPVNPPAPLLPHPGNNDAGVTSKISDGMRMLTAFDETQLVPPPPPPLPPTLPPPRHCRPLSHWKPTTDQDNGDDDDQASDTPVISGVWLLRMLYANVPAFQRRHQEVHSTDSTQHQPQQRRILCHSDRLEGDADHDDAGDVHPRKVRVLDVHEDSLAGGRVVVPQAQAQALCTMGAQHTTAPAPGCNTVQVRSTVQQEDTVRMSPRVATPTDPVQSMKVQTGADRLAALLTIAQAALELERSKAQQRRMPPVETAQVAAGPKQHGPTAVPVEAAQLGNTGSIDLLADAAADGDAGWSHAQGVHESVTTTRQGVTGRKGGADKAVQHSQHEALPAHSGAASERQGDVQGHTKDAQHQQDHVHICQHAACAPLHDDHAAVSQADVDDVAGLDVTMLDASSFLQPDLWIQLDGGHHGDDDDVALDGTELDALVAASAAPNTNTSNSHVPETFTDITPQPPQPQQQSQQQQKQADAVVPSHAASAGPPQPAAQQSPHVPTTTTTTTAQLCVVQHRGEAGTHGDAADQELTDIGPHQPIHLPGQECGTMMMMMMIPAQPVKSLVGVTQHTPPAAILMSTHTLMCSGPNSAAQHSPSLSPNDNTMLNQQGSTGEQGTVAIAGLKVSPCIQTATNIASCVSGCFNTEGAVSEAQLEPSVTTRRNEKQLDADMLTLGVTSLNLVLPQLACQGPTHAMNCEGESITVTIDAQAAGGVAVQVSMKQGAAAASTLGCSDKEMGPTTAPDDAVVQGVQCANDGALNGPVSGAVIVSGTPMHSHEEPVGEHYTMGASMSMMAPADGTQGNAVEPVLHGCAQLQHHQQQQQLQQQQQISNEARSPQQQVQDPEKQSVMEVVVVDSQCVGTAGGGCTAVKAATTFETQQTVLIRQQSIMMPMAEAGTHTAATCADALPSEAVLNDMESALMTCTVQLHVASQSTEQAPALTAAEPDQASVVAAYEYRQQLCTGSTLMTAQEDPQPFEFIEDIGMNSGKCVGDGVQPGHRGVMEGSTDDGAVLLSAEDMDVSMMYMQDGSDQIHDMLDGLGFRQKGHEHKFALGTSGVGVSAVSHNPVAATQNHPAALPADQLILPIDQDCVADHAPITQVTDVNMLDTLMMSQHDDAPWDRPATSGPTSQPDPDVLLYLADISSVLPTPDLSLNAIRAAASAADTACTNQAQHVPHAEPTVQQNSLSDRPQASEEVSDLAKKLTDDVVLPGYLMNPPHLTLTDDVQRLPMHEVQTSQQQQQQQDVAFGSPIASHIRSWLNSPSSLSPNLLSPPLFLSPTVVQTAAAATDTINVTITAAPDISSSDVQVSLTPNVTQVSSSCGARRVTHSEHISVHHNVHSQPGSALHPSSSSSPSRMIPCTLAVDRLVGVLDPSQTTDIAAMVTINTCNRQTNNNASDMKAGGGGNGTDVALDQNVVAGVNAQIQTGQHVVEAGTRPEPIREISCPAAAAVGGVATKAGETSGAAAADGVPVEVHAMPPASPTSSGVARTSTAVTCTNTGRGGDDARGADSDANNSQSKLRRKHMFSLLRQALKQMDGNRAASPAPAVVARHHTDAQKYALKYPHVTSTTSGGQHHHVVDTSSAKAKPNLSSSLKSSPCDVMSLHDDKATGQTVPAPAPGNNGHVNAVTPTENAGLALSMDTYFRRSASEGPATCDGGDLRRPTGDEDVSRPIFVQQNTHHEQLDVGHMWPPGSHTAAPSNDAVAVVRSIGPGGKKLNLLAAAIPDKEATSGSKGPDTHGGDVPDNAMKQERSGMEDTSRSRPGGMSHKGHKAAAPTGSPTVSTATATTTSSTPSTKHLVLKCFKGILKSALSAKPTVVRGGGAPPSTQAVQLQPGSDSKGSSDAKTGPGHATTGDKTVPHVITKVAGTAPDHATTKVTIVSSRSHDKAVANKAAMPVTQQHPDDDEKVPRVTQAYNNVSAPGLHHEGTQVAGSQRHTVDKQRLQHIAGESVVAPHDGQRDTRMTAVDIRPSHAVEADNGAASHPPKQQNTIQQKMHHESPAMTRGVSTSTSTSTSTSLPPTGPQDMVMMTSHFSRPQKRKPPSSSVVQQEVGVPMKLNDGTCRGKEKQLRQGACVSKSGEQQSHRVPSRQQVRSSDGKGRDSKRARQLTVGVTSDTQHQQQLSSMLEPVGTSKPAVSHPDTAGAGSTSDDEHVGSTLIRPKVGTDLQQGKDVQHVNQPSDCHEHTFSMMRKSVAAAGAAGSVKPSIATSSNTVVGVNHTDMIVTRANGTQIPHDAAAAAAASVAKAATNHPSAAAHRTEPTETAVSGKAPTTSGPPPKSNNNTLQQQQQGKCVGGESGNKSSRRAQALLGAALLDTQRPHQRRVVGSTGAAEGFKSVDGPHKKLHRSARPEAEAASTVRDVLSVHLLAAGPHGTRLKTSRQSVQETPDVVQDTPRRQVDDHEGIVQSLAHQAAHRPAQQRSSAAVAAKAAKAAFRFDERGDMREAKKQAAGAHTSKDVSDRSGHREQAMPLNTDCGMYAARHATPPPPPPPAAAAASKGSVCPAVYQQRSVTACLDLTHDDVSSDDNAVRNKPHSTAGSGQRLSNIKPTHTVQAFTPVPAPNKPVEFQSGSEVQHSGNTTQPAADDDRSNPPAGRKRKKFSSTAAKGSGGGNVTSPSKRRAVDKQPCTIPMTDDRPADDTVSPRAQHTHGNLPPTTTASPPLKSHGTAPCHNHSSSSKGKTKASRPPPADEDVIDLCDTE